MLAINAKLVARTIKQGSGKQTACLVTANEYCYILSRARFCSKVELTVCMGSWLEFGWKVAPVLFICLFADLEACLKVECKLLRHGLFCIEGKIEVQTPAPLEKEDTSAEI